MDLGELPWRCLLDLLALARFWSLGPDGRERGEHDNLYVLEAAVRGHYHRVERVGVVTGWDGDFVGVVHDLMEALGDNAIGQLPAEPQSAPDAGRDNG